MTPDTVLADRYVLAEVLGVGGTGTVYRATDLRTGGSVAVKLLHPRFVQDGEYTNRLRREAAIAASLTSPRVVRVTDLDTHAGAPFLVMEYVPGPTLHDYLHARGKLDASEALLIAGEVGRALLAAHARGVVHGDLKPRNIKLVDGQVKVLDFGIARSVSQAEPARADLYLGTPEYSSPEQARGGGGDIRADIYALGIVLFQLTTGRVPFRGRSPLVVLRLHSTAPVPPLPRDVPMLVRALIARCLAKDPDRRFQTPDEFVLAVEEAVAALPKPTVKHAPVITNTIADASGTIELQVAPAPRPNNLSAPLTSFVGRGWELAELRRLLASTRLLTLYGAGGCGKTRLALELANAVLPEYADGVWLVELAGIADPALVIQSIAAALRVREDTGAPLVATLATHLVGRELLIILDNCEHVVAACARAAEELLRGCPRLRILATSREALSVTCETAWRVPSLATSEAVRLFADRAAGVAPGFSVTRDNASAVAAICSELDGIPLALELAAARVRVLPVEQIAPRLTDRLRLLVGGSRTAVARHQTLRGAIDWSYDLLSPVEQQVFNWLAVFAGGFTLEALEAVCSAGQPVGDVLDVLTHLVEKSLVLPPDPLRAGRYQVLETLRQYAAEKLANTGDDAAMQRAHNAYYLALAERAESALTGPDSGSWLAQLDQESDNLRAALSWTIEQVQLEPGLRLGSALWRYWSMRGHISEGRDSLAALLELEDVTPPDGRDDRPIHAKALHSAGTLASQQGDYAAARDLYRRSLALRRALGDDSAVASTLNNLGIVARNVGDYADARMLYEESLVLRQKHGDRWGMSNSLNNLGNVALDQLDYTSARQLHQGSLALRRELGDEWGVANSLNNLGNVAFAEGQYDGARLHYLASLASARALGDKWAIAYLLEDLGTLAAAQAQALRALRLVAAAGSLRESIGAVVSPAERSRLDRRLEPARQLLDEDEQARASSDGRGFLLEDAIDYAIAEAE